MPIFSCLTKFIPKVEVSGPTVVALDIAKLTAVMLVLVCSRCVPVITRCV